MAGFRNKALGLMDRVLRGQMDVREFCAQYETLWNFERDPEDFSEEEGVLFEQLFRTATWYTPFTCDREKNPSFKSEDDVITAVRTVRARITS